MRLLTTKISTLLLGFGVLLTAACQSAGNPTQPAANQPVSVKPENAGNDVDILASGTIQPATTLPPAPKLLDLPDLGQAPDFLNDTWLNTNVPLTLSAVEGKVVLVEFWTFG